MQKNLAFKTDRNGKIILFVGAIRKGGKRGWDCKCPNPCA